MPPFVLPDEKGGLITLGTVISALRVATGPWAHRTGHAAPTARRSEGVRKQCDRDGVCKASRVIEAPTNQRIRKTHEHKVYGTERDLHVE